MFPGDLIAFPRSDPGTLPVQIVDLELNELHFGMVRQDTVEKLGCIMEGKPDMADVTRLFLIFQKTEAVQPFVLLKTLRLQTVQEIIIKIACSGFSQLFTEHSIPVFFLLNKILMQLRCKQKRTAGMSARKTFPHDLFTHEIVIIPGCVKINKPFIQKSVDQSAGFAGIDRPVIGRIAKRKPHKAKSKFFLIIIEHKYALPLI